MGNNKCLVINNTAMDIIIQERKAMFCKTLKHTRPYTGEEKNLGPGEHAYFYPAKLESSWRMKQRVMGISTQIRVSFKSKNSTEGVVLSVSDFKSNAGIVLNIGENNQLVKEPVSREEAKKSKETKSFWKSFWKHKEGIEELKERLISIVNKRNTASTSQPQQGQS